MHRNNKIDTSHNIFGCVPLLFIIYTETFYVFYAMVVSPLAQLIPVALLAGLLFLIKAKKLPTELMISPIDLFWIGSICVFAFSLRKADAGAVYDVVMYAIGIIFMFLLRMDQRCAPKALRIMAAFGVFYAAVTIWQALFTDMYLDTVFQLYPEFWQANLLKNINKGSYAGLTNQSATNAGYCLYAIGALLCMFWDKSYGRRKLLTIGMTVIAVIGLLLTAKRAHLLFGIMAVLVTFYVSNKHKSNRVLKMLLMLVSVFTVIFILSFMISDIGGTLQRFVSDAEVSSGRFMLFEKAWRMFLEHPIMGVGWRQFRLQSAGLLASDVTFEVHNVYLQLLCETGIFGFLFYVIPTFYVYIKTLRCALRRKPDAVMMFSVFIQTFILLYNFTGNALYDYDYLYIYLFACAAVHGTDAKKRMEEQQNEVLPVYAQRKRQSRL